MTTEQPAMAKARNFKACDCDYQRETTWSYDIQTHVGGRRYWMPIGTALTPEGACDVASFNSCVLIRCRGCGKEMIREYPATATGERHE